MESGDNSWRGVDNPSLWQNAKLARWLHVMMGQSTNLEPAMTITYYEILNDAMQPATPKQARLYGTPAYGYRSRIRAELACPNDCSIGERHTDGVYDWSGRIVSYRLPDGQLVRVPN